MKIFLSLIIVITFSVTGFSQESKVTAEEEVFTIVESMPDFVSGRDGLSKYFKDNLNYPEEAKKNSIQGTVYVNFVVNKEGEIIGAKILRGVHDLLDEEALRLMNAMPKWKPGTQRGKRVAVSYNLPIKFRLDQEQSENSEKSKKKNKKKKKK